MREQLSTKLFTIVDESAIADDVQMIERQYAQKGYYLAAVTYTLRNKGGNERVLVFDVIENHEVKGRGDNDTGQRPLQRSGVDR